MDINLIGDWKICRKGHQRHTKTAINQYRSNSGTEIAIFKMSLSWILVLDTGYWILGTEYRIQITSY